jgi:hypothetical protein
VKLPLCPECPKLLVEIKKLRSETFDNEQNLKTLREKFQVVREAKYDALGAAEQAREALEAETTDLEWYTEDNERLEIEKAMLKDAWNSKVKQIEVLEQAARLFAPGATVVAPVAAAEEGVIASDQASGLTSALRGSSSRGRSKSSDRKVQVQTRRDRKSSPQRAAEKKAKKKSAEATTAASVPLYADPSMQPMMSCTVGGHPPPTPTSVAPGGVSASGGSNVAGVTNAVARHVAEVFHPAGVGHWSDCLLPSTAR